MRLHADGVFELTAHAAAIEAGFRKPPDPFAQMVALLPRVSDDERRRLRALL